MFPYAASSFTTYASISTSLMLFRSIFNDLIPGHLRKLILSALSYLFRFCSDKQTVVIEQSDGNEPNQVFNASEVYLSTKISPDTKRLKVSKRSKDKDLTFKLDKGQRITDFFQGIELKWRYVYNELERKAEMIESEARVLHTLGNFDFCKFKWESIKLEHPSTFATLALDIEQKNMIMEDINRFLRRKEFCKRVWRSWKCGYLLYGPQLENVKTDSELRKLLLDIANKSILMIEDIDCTVNLPDHPTINVHKHSGQERQLTLSGLLNFIDGLWSSCGDERIIVLTTNHKQRLDPALLRPGRMDVNINLSCCTMQAFRILAPNYLGIKVDHWLFKDIDELVEATKVTPAEVAEELMKNEVVDNALEGFFSFLKQKELEHNELEAEASKKVEIKESKELKIEPKTLKQESTPMEE
ncbi:hypothetical protein REPUB_Repub10bG0168200 [Reevesia pubescens]